MELSCDSVAADYPDQDVLSRQWRLNLSPWAKQVHNEILSGDRDNAIKTLSPGRVDRLVNEEDSPQKVFDMYGIAMMLMMLNDLEFSKELLIELLKIVPYPVIDVDISGLCLQMGQLSGRVEYLEKAYQKCPDNPVVWNFLGSALMNLDQKERGLEFLRKSVEAKPENQMVHSNYLFYTHHSDELEWQEIFDDHLRWARNISVKNPVIKNHDNKADPDRKLRIGYISPDFRTHPVGLLVMPVIESHDRNNFEVYGYGCVARPDIMTKMINKKCDHYRHIMGVDDKSLVEMIVKDKIDILIDLAGHTGNHRLTAMSHKPAPVQVTYLGYFETTGLEQIDYFLTDSQMAPPESQRYHTEELFYLPDTCFCYSLPEKASDVVPSPVLENGYITFGMFSNPSKITPKMAGLWARILENTENSRLKLTIKDGNDLNTVSVYTKILENAGIPRERFHIQGKMALGKYLKEYGKVDIILDTYPYNGGATTCDAFWMGVPVVSLVGEHHFSRVGLSLLTAVGLDYFAAETEDEYVAKASVLAAMPESLAKIRGTLRQRVTAGPLGNPGLQTRNIEDAYRQMWRRWCLKKK